VRRLATVLKWVVDRKNARYAVLLLLVILVAIVIAFLRQVTLPFFLAIFLAYLLDPVIRLIIRVRIYKWHPHRGIAVLLVYALIVWGLGAAAYYGIPKLVVEVNRMGGAMPAMLDQFEKDLIRPLDQELGRLFASYAAEPDGIQLGGGSNSEGVVSGPVAAPTAPGPLPPAAQAVKPLLDDYYLVFKKIDDSRFEIIPQHKRPKQPMTNGRFSLNQQLTQYFGQLRGDVEVNMGQMISRGRRLVEGISTFIWTLFLVFMLAGFILVNPGRIGEFMKSMIPRAHLPVYEGWVKELDQGLGGVVRGQVIICLINGSLTAVGIAFLGIPFWFTLSLTATLFSLIPIFGVLISTIPIVIMGLTVSLYTALLALGWILLIHFIEGNFLNPKILGDAAKIHPVLIVFSLVVGEYMAGVVGALLAVPIFSVIYNSFRYLKTLAERVEQSP
jgi:predicted PurR-regulated permease PerM